MPVVTDGRVHHTVGQIAYARISRCSVTDTGLQVGTVCHPRRDHYK
jgi:hypothetical protein